MFSVLSMLGVGLIFMSIAAFRNATRPPDDAIDKVFLDTLESHTSRLFRLLSLPLDFLLACKDVVVAVLLAPFRLASAGLSRVGKLGGTLIESVQQWLLWLLSFPGALLSSLLEGLRGTVEAVGTGLAEQVTTLMSVVDQSFVGVLIRTTAKSLSGVTARTKIRWILLNRRVSATALAIEDSGMQVASVARAIFDGDVEATTKATSNLRSGVSKLMTAIEHEQKTYQGRLSTEYVSLNRSLEKFALSVETLLGRLVSNFRLPKN
jgi:hypothetical protein